LFTLVLAATASAPAPGSSGDPLITRSYLEGQFAASLRGDISSALGGAADKAMVRLDEAYMEIVGYDFSPRFAPVSMMAGDTVALSAGASFILLSGSASLTVSAGTVINVSSGSVAASGSALTLNQRYFCTEEAKAVVTASSAAAGQVDGYYFAQGAGIAKKPLPFTDVPQGAWFHPAIDFVYGKGYFAGTSATAFSPNASMTRAMFVTVLHRLEGRPAVSVGGAFSDVKDPGLYYYAAVGWASANNIVRGYEDGTFQPDRPVTREEMATFMHRYASFKGRGAAASGGAFDTFPDRGDVSGFAIEPMRWAVAAEVIRGSGGKLLPGNTATRAEVAQIILNYCEKIGVGG